MRLPINFFVCFDVGLMFRFFMVTFCRGVSAAREYVYFLFVTGHSLVERNVI